MLGGTFILERASLRSNCQSLSDNSVALSSPLSSLLHFLRSQHSAVVPQWLLHHHHQRELLYQKLTQRH